MVQNVSDYDIVPHDTLGCFLS